MPSELTLQLLTLKKTCDLANRKGFKTPAFRDAMRAPVVLAMIEVIEAYRDADSPEYITKIEKAEEVLTKALGAVNG